MRQRLSDFLRVAAAAALCVGPGSLSAQVPTATEGAIFLLLPVGARAAALGEATAASRAPSEAIWWNPAGVGSAVKREIAIHHSSSFVGTGDAVTIILPSSLLGVLGLEFNLIDYGDQDIVDNQNNPLGTLLPRSIVLGATYGTMIGGAASTGISFKMVQLRVDCSGTCQAVPTFSGTSYAVDVGLQYDFTKHLPLALGASVRNLGLPFQINDGPQSDPLPRRAQVGAEYRYVPPSTVADSVELRVSFDLLSPVDRISPKPRIGGEVAWRQRAYARAGYVAAARGSESGGPSIGFGYVSGGVSVDIARVLTGFSADAGQAPTFLTLRLRF